MNVQAADRDGMDGRTCNECKEEHDFPCEDIRLVAIGGFGIVLCLACLVKLSISLRKDLGIT